jgi:hypothetical protein
MTMLAISVVQRRDNRKGTPPSLDDWDSSRQG